MAGVGQAQAFERWHTPYGFGHATYGSHLYQQQHHHYQGGNWGSSRSYSPVYQSQFSYPSSNTYANGGFTNLSQSNR
ncbi:hypothetical protein Pla8534_14550 [Lignipirellula cremea]|uniref:Uncharacterized protein n=2 Tax=Lignipirellula cremea TaxID=2528010 RepID=A0A518DPB7_9BACT|nr:hypothetical protein Pla8534_14550 [Lignipirellula cremea]